jgi:hypothetical protein
MSFDNIQLPDFLLADLYKDCLVELENVQVLQPTNKPPEPGVTIHNEPVGPTGNLRYLGENKKHIAILVHDGDATFLNDGDLLFLTNVLKACNLTIGDIAIVNAFNQSLSYDNVSQQLSPVSVLLFGVDPAAINLPFSVPDFQPQPFSGCTYLKAPALAGINQPTADGKMFKTKLWMNLQKIFEIK